MQRNNLISDKQYGFFPIRATTLRLLNEWTEILTKERKKGCVFVLPTMRRESAQKPKNGERSVPKVQRILRETRKNDCIISKNLECKPDMEEVEAMIKES